MRKFLILAAVAGGLAAFSNAGHAGTMVVISSNMPGMRAGAMIDGSKAIRLEGGISVTLVSADGRTVKLAGPYSGAPDPSPGSQRPELLSAISEMVSRPDRNTSSGGIMRSSLYAPKDPWVINSESNDWQCFRDDQSPQFWRPMAVGQVEAQLRTAAQDGGPVAWADGGHNAQWPEALPPQDGATYRLQFSRSRRVQAIKMRLLPSTLQNDAGRAAWMHRAGCLRQARALLRQLQG